MNVIPGERVALPCPECGQHVTGTGPNRGHLPGCVYSSEKAFREADDPNVPPAAARISRDQLFMVMAEAAAQRGTCDRAHVGAIIAMEGRPISMGYNGAPPGHPHCTEIGHGKQQWIVDQIHTATRDAQELGCTRAVHAEANAIAWAARSGVPTFGGEMYCTYSPCKTCAELILASGIGRFVYRNDYRAARLDLLDSIEVIQL